MTLTEALAVKARGLTKEQIIAHLRAVAENNLRADIRTIERAWKEKPSEGISAKSASNSKYRHGPGGFLFRRCAFPAVRRGVIPAPIRRSVSR